MTSLCFNNFLRYQMLSKPKLIKIFVDNGQKLSTANHILSFTSRRHTITDTDDKLTTNAMPCIQWTEKFY